MRTPQEPSADSTPKTRLFLSYGRRDGRELADRLRADLESHGYEVWEDTQRIRAGGAWDDQIVDGLRSTELVIALLSPHAVRRSGAPGDPDDTDSVCLDEITFARFARPPKPIVPVMAEACEPPFCIFRLEYVDMQAWREEEAIYQAGLRRVLVAVQAALKGEVRYRWWEPTLRPWDFTAFLFEKRKHFCGREWLMQEIDAWRSSGAGRALLITGDPGIGKSALVAQLVHLNPGNQVLAYHCCQGDTKDTLDPAMFIRSIAAMIASKLNEYAEMLRDPAVEDALEYDKCSSDPGSSFERGVLTPLEHLAAPESGVRYILIDALDEALLRPPGSSNIVDVLTSRLERLPHWLRIVATTRRHREVLDRLAGLHAKNISAHDPRNLDDVSKYIRLRLGGTTLKQRLEASGQSPDTIRSILMEKSDGSFLYVQQVLEGIDRDIYGFDDLAGLPPGLRGLYLRDLSIRYPDEEAYGPVRSVLEALVAAEEPLTESMLALSTGMRSDDELPRILRSLSGYLRETISPGNGSRYAIYHASFADWLAAPEQRGTLYHINAKRGGERLAQACWEDYKRRGLGMSSYSIEHLPTHLAQAGRFQELLEVVKRAELGFMRRWVGEGKGEKGLVCLTGLIESLEAQNTESVTRAGLASQVARIYSLRGDYDKAEDWLTYALRHTSRWRGRRARVVALHELGSLALYRSRFSEASKLYRRALRLCLWAWPVYHDEAAANLIGLATVSEAMNAYGDAIRCASRGIREARKAGDLLHVVAGQRLIAAAQKSTGEYSEAEQNLNAALLISELQAVHLEKARILLLMGWLHHDQATLRNEISGEARNLFQQALDAARHVHDLFCAVEAEISLCWQDLSAKETVHAGAYLESLKRALSPELHPQLRAGIEVAAAAEAHQKGDLPEAARMYDKAIAFCAAHECNAWKRRALIGLGATHWHRGNTAEAEQFWDEALKLAERSSKAKRELAAAIIGVCRRDRSEIPR